MIFAVQFGVNKHLQIFSKTTILLVLEKIYNCLFITNYTRNHMITYTKMYRNLRAHVPIT